MKILLVNKFHYMKGGSEKYYFTLADTLVKMGHEVIYFAMNDDKNIPCEQSKYFVSSVGINGGIKNKIKLVLHMNYSKEAHSKMNELLDQEKPDIAILNLVHKQITLSIISALKKHNVKIVWTMHDLITVCPAYTMLDGNGNICEKCMDGNFNHCKQNKCIHNSTLMSILSTREAKYIKKKDWYNDVDLYICPSQFYKKKLEEAKFTNSRITYMANPLPLDTKYELSKSSNEYILYFGRLSKEKGIATLIKAMKNVNYKLIILGTGPLKEELEQLIKNENLESKVSMLGFKQGEELTKFIEEARCVVLPSEWYENGPYSAMEAMALGKPLIVSNYGGLPELVQQDINGYIFNNENELEQAINNMIVLDEDKYLEMCKKSLQIAKEKFNPEIYVVELLKNLEA